MNLHNRLILIKVLISTYEAMLPSLFPMVWLAMLLLFSIPGVSILEEVWFRVFLHGSMAQARRMLAAGKHSHGLLWLPSRLGLHPQKLLTLPWMRIADVNTYCNTMSLCFLCTVPFHFLFLLFVTWKFIVIASASEAVCGICIIKTHGKLPLPFFLIKRSHLGK